MNEYILEMKDIVKRFPGTLALDNVNFNLKKGEVMALIGENGAGKSTLMNVLMGVYNLDSGEIFLNGEKIENKSPFEALQKGIGMVPQELNLVPDISIAENIFLGREPLLMKGIIDDAAMNAEAQKILDDMNVPYKATQQLRRLPVTQNGHLTGMLSLADLARRGNFSMETAQCMESICSPVVHLD